ncbi:Ig-like domain-containing protein [Persicobacter psychrovividus]|uniref:Uncharacterized protein n=1 Tax=Persicobacter psychrovividus TaxID=387638 RepID=A0ABN6LCZ3_9BACT|nr:hypothetical protein PEPS_33250 [Persicobacter psychrovividus]
MKDKLPIQILMLFLMLNVITSATSTSLASDKAYNKPLQYSNFGPTNLSEEHAAMDTLLYNRIFADFLIIASSTAANIELIDAHETGNDSGATNVNQPEVKVKTSLAAAVKGAIFIDGTELDNFPLTSAMVDETFKLYPLGGNPGDPLPDGSYELKLTVYDNGDNVIGNSQTYDLFVDTVQPDPWTVALAQDSNTGFNPDDNFSNVAKPKMEFRGVTEIGTFFYIKVSYKPLPGGQTKTFAEVPVKDYYAVNLGDIIGGELGDGSFEVFCTVSDGAGNESVRSIKETINIDTTAPVDPTAIVMQDASGNDIGSVTAITQPYFETSGEASGLMTFVFTKGGATVSTVTLDKRTESVSGLDDYLVQVGSQLADGNYSVTASLTDKAGNVSSASPTFNFKIDTTPPPVPSQPQLVADDDTGDQGDNITSKKTVRFEGTAEQGSTVTLTAVNGGVSITGSAVVDAAGKYVVTLDFNGEADATYSITATATDPAGNTSNPTQAISFTIDSTPPAVPSNPVLSADTDTGRSDSDMVTNAQTVKIIGTTENPSYVTIEISGEENRTVGPVKFTTGNYAFDVAGLPEGNYTLKALAVDIAGNGPVASVGVTNMVIDRQAPSAPIAAVLNNDPADDTGDLGDHITSNKNGRLVGSSETNSIVRFSSSINGDIGALTIPVPQTSFLFTPSGMTEGVHEITYTAEDLAGNISAVSAPYTLTIVPAILAQASIVTAPLAINEDGGQAISTITLATPADQSVTVNLGFTGTATKDVDYSVSASSVTIPAGELTATVTYNAISDDVFEPNETVITTITSVTNGAVGSPSSSEFSIIDQSVVPTLSMENANMSVQENAGAPIEVKVVLSVISGKETKFKIQTSGTAPTSDYTLVPKEGIEVVIPIGAKETTIQFTPTDNNKVDGNRTAILTLTEVLNANLSTEDNTVVTIIDDDQRPEIVSVDVPASKTYLLGETLTFTLNFDKDITVTGSPLLNLAVESGNVAAAYQSGTGTSAITFAYTVQVNDEDLNGLSLIDLVLNGGSLQDAFGNDADLTLNNVPSTAGVKIDAKINLTAAVTPNPVEADEDVQSPVFIVGPQASDDAQTKGYKVKGVASGKLFLASGAEVAAGTYISRAQAANGLYFMPDSGFFGSGKVTIQGTLIAGNDSGLSGPDTEIIINVKEFVPPQISMERANLSVAENAGAAVDVKVMLSAASTQATRFKIQLSGDAPATDYTLTPVAGTEMVIPAGSTEVTISFLPIDNQMVDGDRSAVLTLAEISNATLGSHESTVVNIIDDDQSPMVTLVDVPAAKTYLLGETMSFTVSFDQVMTVSGTPLLNLLLETGNIAAEYKSGNGTNVLTFEYTVMVNDEEMTAVQVIDLVLNGGGIVDTHGNPADLTLNNISSTAGVLVDAKINLEANVTPNPVETDQDGQSPVFQVMPQASDDQQVAGYQVVAIENGKLYDPSGTEVQVNNFVTKAQAANGFYFVPDADFVGTGKVTLKGTLISGNDAGLSGPETDIIINVNRVNKSPVVVVPAPAPIVGVYGQVMSLIDLKAYIIDPDGPADGSVLSYSVSFSPAGIADGSLSGEFLTLNLLNVGETIMTISLNDGEFTVTTTTKVTVTKAALTVQANNKTKIYGDPNPVLDYTISGFVNGEDESVIQPAIQISTAVDETASVGLYPINISGGSAANYEIVYNGGELEVTPAPLLLTANDKQMTQGMEVPTLDGDIEGIKNNDNITADYTTSVTPNTEPGTYPIEVSANGDALILDNYDITLEDGILTVEGPGGLFVPTVFTPNGDGSNDVFRLRGRGVAEIHLRVYNARGVIVFETTDVGQATEIGWDGKYQGTEQPQGNYVWQVSGKLSDGSPIELDGKKLGNISLIR